jgi:hypothetical protein
VPASKLLPLPTNHLLYDIPLLLPSSLHHHPVFRSYLLFILFFTTPYDFFDTHILIFVSPSLVNYIGFFIFCSYNNNWMGQARFRISPTTGTLFFLLPLVWSLRHTGYDASNMGYLEFYDKAGLEFGDMCLRTLQLAYLAMTLPGTMAILFTLLTH